MHNFTLLENEVITPLASQDAKGRAPIVISHTCNDKYAYQASTTFLSLKDAMDPTRNYEVNVLHPCQLSDYNKQTLSGIFIDTPNVTLRFIDILEHNAKYWEKWTGAFGGRFNLHRLFIYEMFSNYDRILSMDVDLVYKCDLSALFDMKMSDDTILAGAPDVTMHPNWDRKEAYLSSIGTHLKDYINTGVVVVNMVAARKYELPKLVVEHLDRMKNDNLYYTFEEQDFMNITADGHKVFLDAAYNFVDVMVHWDCAAYMKMPPQIFHSVGKRYLKNLDTIVECAIWEYARKSPYYETFIRVLLVDTSIFIHECNAPHCPERPEQKKIDPIVMYNLVRRHRKYSLLSKFLPFKSFQQKAEKLKKRIEEMNA